MSQIEIDARGLSCPQPVLLVVQKIKQTPSGRIDVLVDCGASRENVARAASSQGWSLAEEDLPGGGYRLVLSK
jgi:TusA-related sulfurtransferase